MSVNVSSEAVRFLAIVEVTVTGTVMLLPELLLIAISAVPERIPETVMILSTVTTDAIEVFEELGVMVSTIVPSAVAVAVIVELVPSIMLRVDVSTKRVGGLMDVEESSPPPRQVKVLNIIVPRSKLNNVGFMLSPLFLIILSIATGKD